MSVRIQTGNDLGTAILKALGIDSKHVLEVGISLKANEMATINIVRSLDQADAGKLLTTLEQYTLERRPEDPKAAAMETVARNLLKGGGDVHR